MIKPANENSVLSREEIKPLVETLELAITRLAVLEELIGRFGDGSAEIVETARVELKRVAAGDLLVLLNKVDQNALTAIQSEIALREGSAGDSVAGSLRTYMQDRIAKHPPYPPFVIQANPAPPSIIVTSTDIELPKP